MSPHISSRVAFERGRRLVLGLLLAAVAAILGGFAMTSAAQAAAPDKGKPYEIRFRHSNKCLDNPSATWIQSMPLQQYACQAPAHNEHWILDPVFDDGPIYRIRNEQSNKCVNVGYASLADWEPIVQYTCGAWSNESFALTRTPGMPEDYFKLKNVNSEKCLNVAYGSSDNNAGIIQYACDGYWPQGTENMQVRFVRAH
jgi:hypothetical protein